MFILSKYAFYSISYAFPLILKFDTNIHNWPMIRNRYFQCVQMYTLNCTLSNDIHIGINTHKSVPRCIAYMHRIICHALYNSTKIHDKIHVSVYHIYWSLYNSAVDQFIELYVDVGISFAFILQLINKHTMAGIGNDAFKLRTGKSFEFVIRTKIEKWKIFIDDVSICPFKIDFLFFYINKLHDTWHQYFFFLSSFMHIPRLQKLHFTVQLLQCLVHAITSAYSNKCKVVRAWICCVTQMADQMDKIYGCRAAVEIILVDFFIKLCGTGL